MINKVIVALIIVFAFLSQLSSADTEFWPVFNFQIPLQNKVKLSVMPEFRLKENGTDWYYLRTYIGPTVSLSKMLDFAVYLAPSISKSGQNWNYSTLGYADLILKNQLPWFVFVNRARFEENFTSNVLIYRHLFQFNFDNWSAGDEFFYNTGKGYYDEGRSSIFYSFKINKELSLSLGYLLRRQKPKSTDDWQRTTAITTGLKIDY